MTIKLKEYITPVPKVFLLLISNRKIETPQFLPYLFILY